MISYFLPLDQLGMLGVADVGGQHSHQVWLLRRIAVRPHLLAASHDDVVVHRLCRPAQQPVQAPGKPGPWNGDEAGDAAVTGEKPFTAAQDLLLL